MGLLATTTAPRLSASSCRAYALSLCFMAWTACAAAPLDLPAWHAQAAAVPIGATFTPPDDDEETRATLRAFGFIHIGNGVFERQADTLAHDVLQESYSEQLPGVDAVAVISVYRPELKDKQYLYPTLRSLLDELPETFVVNVLVGTADADYVSAATLEQELGAQPASRVHVLHAPSDVAQFFAANNIPVSARAGWNYSRGLRSYVGTSHLMIFEDDVILSHNFTAHIRPWLAAPPAEGLALFNRRCKAGKNPHRLVASALKVRIKSIKRNRDFPTTQAFLFSARTAQSAGSFLAYRAGREAYDYMLGRFFAEDTRRIAMFIPSPVQHIGFSTTGLSSPKYLPISNCYVDALP